jgi:glutaredoxin 3
MPNPSEVVMYSTRFCPYCTRARQLLAHKASTFSELVFKDIGVDGDPALRARMEALSGRHTVPQIWVGDTHVGGFDELWALEQRGELDPLLQRLPITQ